MISARTQLIRETANDTRQAKLAEWNDSTPPPSPLPFPSLFFLSFLFPPLPPWREDPSDVGIYMILFVLALE